MIDKDKKIDRQQMQTDEETKAKLHFKTKKETKKRSGSGSY
jgi:desulfoferrodoxin (superoxide reductase-like protein)